MGEFLPETFPLPRVEAQRGKGGGRLPLGGGRGWQGRGLQGGQGVGTPERGYPRALECANETRGPAGLV